MTILDQIIAHKRREISALKNRVSRTEFEQSEFFNAPRKSFVNELKRADKVGIIAEFKRRSPSKGVINANVTIEEVAADYEKAGASALSVLTDEKFFGGSNEDLQTARRFASLPVLRKDFIVDEFQIIEARAIGASAILLIAAALGAKEIQSLAKCAATLDLEVLLEVHEPNEIPVDLSNVNAIGINNRNLHDFSVDVKRSFEIAAQLPNEIVKISESGLRDAATISELKSAGFSGFLIGETFMQTEQPGAACANLIAQIRAAQKG